MNREQAAHDLEAARDFYIDHEWMRRRFGDDTGGCLLRAIWHGAQGDAVRIRAARLALDGYLEQAYAADLHRLEGHCDPLLLTRVNDVLLHDKDDAMDVLAKAAIDVRGSA